MFVVRRGKTEVTHERADKLKVGDFLLVQLNSASPNAKVSKIITINKAKVPQTKLAGVRTTHGHFIAGTNLASDKSDVCGNVSFGGVVKFLQEENPSKL